MAGNSVGYATLPIIPSVQGFGPALAEGIAAPSAAAGAAAGAGAGEGFLGGFTKFLAPAVIAAAVVGGFKALYDIGGIVADVTDEIRIGTGAQGDALDGLVVNVQNVANRIPESLTTIGSAVTEVTQRLGYTGPVLEGFTARLLEVGRLQKTEVPVETLSAALNGFHVPASQANSTLDRLFNISQATGVPVATLTGAIAKQGSVLGNLGFSLTDAATTFGVLDKAGVNSQLVLRSLGQGIVRLSRQGEQPVDAFHRVTHEIQGFIDSGDKAAALDLAGKIFGARGAAQFVGAIQSGVLNINDIQASIASTGDTILGVAAETNHFKENLLILKNNAIDRLAPAGNAVFGLFNEGFSKLTQFIVGLPPLPDIFGPMATAAQPFLAVVGPALTTAFQSVWTAIGPLIPQLAQLWANASPVAIVMKVLTPILPQLASLFAQLVGIIGKLAATILPVLIPVVTQVAGILGGLLAKVLPIVINLLTTLTPVFGQLGAMIGSLVAGVLPILVPILSKVADILGGVLAAVLPIVGQLIASLAPIFIQLTQAMLPVITAVLSLISPILDLITPLLALIGPILSPLIDLLVQVIGFALQPLMMAFQEILPPILDVVGVLVKSLMPVIKAVTEILGGLIDFLTGVFTGNWKLAWKGIVEVFSGIWNGITGILKGVLNVAISIINGIIGGINKVGSAISDATSGAISFKIPKIPSLASGADITARSGGTLALLGEAGQDETVTNLGTTNAALDATTALAERALDAGGLGDRQALVDALTAALDAVLAAASLNLSDETIDRLARALAALQRLQSRQGGLVNA